MDEYGDNHRAKSKTEVLLRASHHFLEKRDFKGCRKYALQADPPNNPSAAQILAVCDVLSASEHRFNGRKIDWYAVLGLDRFSNDPHLIRENFKRLASLINPNKNKLHLADEAFGVLVEAYSVLSDDWKRTQFDNELRMFESVETPQNLQEKMEGNCGFGLGLGEESTFWTMCPYCYYVYNYNRVYEDCCMRCPNHNCKRAFEAVPVQSPPPEAVVRNGRYWCLGFRPIGFEGEDGKKLVSWTPFSALGNGSERNTPIVIEDDEDNVAGDELNTKSKNVTTTEEEVKVDGEGPSMVKPVGKRIKSVARSSKKMMGKGTRVRRSVPFTGYFEEVESDACASKDAVGSGFGVKFTLEDDDIFVGVEDDDL